jgi:hypothetical protein
MPESRKLAAILAADVVGFSRLAGADRRSTGMSVSPRSRPWPPMAVTSLSRGFYPSALAFYYVLAETE